MALFMVNLFVSDPPYLRNRRARRIDYPGFLAMALWLVIYAQVIRQATLLAYADNFRLMAALAVACVPLVILFRKAGKPEGSVSALE